MTNLKLSGNVSCGRIYVEEEDEPKEAGPKACSYNHCSEDSHTCSVTFSLKDSTQDGGRAVSCVSRTEEILDFWA